MFPEIRLSDSVVIPTYLLYLSLLYCFLVLYADRRAKTHHLSTADTLNFSLILMVGGFLGARFFHVFYEMPQYYAEDWSRAFKFWDGGFVFFGGFLGGLLGSLIYQRAKKLSFRRWADFFSPVIALGYGLGRGSCFLAGCCYGKSCEAPWAVVFPWDLHQTPRHPTQVYAILWELCAFALLIWLEKRKVQLSRPGLIFAIWLASHALGRLQMEFFRDDFRGDLILGLTVSTWMSLFVFATATGLMVLFSGQPERPSPSPHQKSRH